ncbi:MAG: LysR substrate-binding domain-containing protein [Thermaerobacter sp.]|nr:LysR substrate-binding domain-containing protein [Thermaerobacter sp.]
MRDRSEGMGPDLAVGTTAITGGQVLPRLLPVFNHRLPGVRVRLVEAAGERLEKLTARAMVDVSPFCLCRSIIRICPAGRC